MSSVLLLIVLIDYSRASIYGCIKLFDYTWLVFSVASNYLNTHGLVVYEVLISISESNSRRTSHVQVNKYSNSFKTELDHPEPALQIIRV